MAHFTKMPQILVICGFAAFANSCKLHRNETAQTKEAVANDVDADIEIEMTDVDLPGPIENLLSLVYGTPVFGDGGKKKTALKYNRKGGLDPINNAMNALASRPDLKNVLKIDDGGTEQFVVAVGRDTVTIQKYHGVCIDNYVFALGAYLPSGSNIIATFTEEYELRLEASMPPTLRPDLKSCKDRFKELVDIKFKGAHDAAAALQAVENLDLMLTWMPGYLGAEEFSEGKHAKGLALIVGDIVTLGLFAKYKAGWATLRMSERTFEVVKTGARITLIGSNAILLGTLVKDAANHKLSPVGAGIGLLVLTQTGFTIHRLVIKPPLPR